MWRRRRRMRGHLEGTPPPPPYTPRDIVCYRDKGSVARGGKYGSGEGVTENPSYYVTVHTVAVKHGKKHSVRGGVLLHD